MMDGEPRGVLAAFDELLKNPSAGVDRVLEGGTLRPALAILVGALVCYVFYGAASGFFQGGGQVLLAALKAPLVVLFSVGLCLPSLYILSALMGAEISARRLLVIVASFAGTLGIFMAGLLPITWLFSVSSRSLPFMVWLHLGLWVLTVILAGRCLQLLLRQMGARALIAPWILLFLVVSFQSATLFRPLIWQPSDAPRFPGLNQKMSFLEHFGLSMDTTAEAGAAADGAAALDAIVGADHALARTATRIRTPRLGDISRAGDLGWVTGPYAVTSPNAREQHGVYLSIWKQQPDGTWRVQMQAETPTPEPVTFEADGFVRALGAANRYTRRVPEDGLQPLLDADREIAQQAKANPLVLLQMMNLEPRLHRPNLAPMVSRDAIHRYLYGQPSQVTFRPIDGAVASSQDLGYTFGRYDTAPSGSGAAGDSGTYVRVWTRWPSGTWTIVADVTTLDAPR